MVCSVLEGRLGQAGDECFHHLLDEGGHALIPFARDLLDVLLETRPAANVPLLVPAGCTKMAPVGIGDDLLGSFLSRAFALARAYSAAHELGYGGSIAAGLVLDLRVRHL